MRRSHFLVITFFLACILIPCIVLNTAAVQGDTLILPPLGETFGTNQSPIGGTDGSKITMSGVSVSKNAIIPDFITDSEVTSSTDSQNEVLIVLSEKAFYLNANEDYQKAEELCSQALAVYPNDPGLLSMNGWSLLGLDRPDEALEVLEASLAIRPDNALALCNKACALFSLGRYEDTITTINQADSLDPLNSLNKYLRREAEIRLEVNN